VSSQDPAVGERSLAGRVLPGVEVLAQSIATVSPSGVIAITPAIVALNAGNGTWLAFVVAMIAVLLVGYSVAQFSRRIASTGSLYTYIGRGLGRVAGFAGGAAMVIAYGAVAMISMVAAGLYFGAFLTEIGIAGDRLGVQLVLYALFGAAGIAFAVLGVRLSTRFALTLEIIAIGSILTVLLIVFFDQGLDNASTQFGLEGATFDGIALGVVFAVLALSGFESCASMGAEASDPYRAIPRAILGTIIGIGLLYTFAAYTQVVAFVNAGENIGESAAPLNDIAGFAGAEWLKYPILLGATASFFASITGCINAGSRTLFTMGRERVAPESLGRTHARRRTPHVAALTLAPIVLLVPIVMVAQGSSAVSAITYIGTTGAFGFMLSYALVAIAAIPYARRRRVLGALTVICGVAGAAAMAYVFYKNIVPTPPAPLNRVPYIFAALLALGLAWYAVGRLRDPEHGHLVGTLGDEIEEDRPLAAPR